MSFFSPVLLPSFITRGKGGAGIEFTLIWAWVLQGIQAYSKNLLREVEQDRLELLRFLIKACVIFISL